MNSQLEATKTFSKVGDSNPLLQQREAIHMVFDGHATRMTIMRS